MPSRPFGRIAQPMSWSLYEYTMCKHNTKLIAAKCGRHQRVCFGNHGEKVWVTTTFLLHVLHHETVFVRSPPSRGRGSTLASMTFSGELYKRALVEIGHYLVWCANAGCHVHACKSHLLNRELSAVDVCRSLQRAVVISSRPSRVRKLPG